MELTIESIKADIDSFNVRISEAQQRLSDLPCTSNNWKDRKRIGTERNRLLSVIDHVKRIRSYAIDALAEL